MNKSLLATVIFAVAVLACPGCGRNVKPEEDIDPFSTTDPSTTAGTSPMTVCTFNIRYPNSADQNPDGSAAGWTQRRQAVKKFVDTVKPDLIALQEVNPSQAKDFASWFSADYVYYDVGRDSRTGASVVSANCEGVAILFLKSRFSEVARGFFWLDENPNTRPEANATDGGFGAWASNCRRICVWFHLKDKDHNNSDVWLFGAHYDHKSAAAREGSANLMVSQMKSMCGAQDLKENRDVVVFHLGDFNVRYDDKNPSTATNVQLQPLVDNLYYSRLKAPGTDKDTYTYNAYGSGTGTLIDHIFYGGKYVKPLKYWVDRSNYGVPYISDHYPVLFQWEYYK